MNFESIEEIMKRLSTTKEFLRAVSDNFTGDEHSNNIESALYFFSHGYLSALEYLLETNQILACKK